MSRLSYSAQLAWQFAAEQAVQSGCELIEPAHLLMGILNLEEVFAAAPATARLFTKISLEAIRVEWTELMGVLLHASCTPYGLRVFAEKQIVAGPCDRGASRRVSRSPATRSIFSLADKLAEEAGSSMTGLIYLLAALFEKEDFAGGGTRPPMDLKQLRESLAHARRNRLESPTAAFARNAATSQSSSLPDMQNLRLAMAAKRSEG